jgi:hypothetical protein
VISFTVSEDILGSTQLPKMSDVACTAGAIRDQKRMFHQNGLDISAQFLAGRDELVWSPAMEEKAYQIAPAQY